MPVESRTEGLQSKYNIPHHVIAIVNKFNHINHVAESMKGKDVTYIYEFLDKFYSSVNAKFTQKQLAEHIEKSCGAGNYETIIVLYLSLEKIFLYI